MIDPTAVKMEDVQTVNPWIWAYWNKLKLASGDFRVEGHEYQVGVMQSQARKRVIKKAAQMTFSESEILRTLHGMIYGMLPKGCLYLFPTDDDVSEFSKARFTPLIEYNPASIGKYVSSTDATNIKRIGRSFLYLHGARATSRVSGHKKDSSKLRSRSVDKVVFDERDLMDPAMVQMALERFSHSDVQEEVEISTPTVPGWGVDESYENSDQRVWMIKCRHCGGYTCLEQEFPDCLRALPDGEVIRICKKCSKEIFPRDGSWIPMLQGREVEGYTISQLNSSYVSPKKILELYQNPPNGDLQEFYNSKLGMAYVNAENKLTMQDIYACCGKDAMRTHHQGSCAMGVDVGSLLNVVVGYRPSEKVLNVCYMARVSSFDDVHDIAARFNVKSAVIDAEPELRKAREFSDSEPYQCYVCDYDHNLVGFVVYDDKKLIKANRTWLCDVTHNLIVENGVILPRKCGEMEVFAKQVSAAVKTLQEEADGSRKYVYLKATDHYRHALNYMWLASKNIGIADDDTPEKKIMKMIQDRQSKDYEPLTFGMVA